VVPKTQKRTWRQTTTQSKTKELEYYEDYEDIPCPECGKPIDICVPLNANNVDFEGAFLGTKPRPFPCPHCGKKVLATPKLQWKIEKVKI
jgi:predicted RNA-binding Zn-ribbon protein involved in translation (DUF1610 family)